MGVLGVGLEKYSAGADWAYNWEFVGIVGVTGY